MPTIEQNLIKVLARIEAACKRTNRSESSVQLIGVSKKQPVEAVQQYIDACARLGMRCVLGENYVQEFAAKKPQLKGDFQSHFIGHLQSNKAKEAVTLFDTIQTVDSIKLATELVKRTASKKISVMIEVNITADPAKHGFLPESDELVRVLTMPGLSVVGLMTITEYYEQSELARAPFRKLASLAKALEITIDRPLLLSMGMSADFEVAIEEGATQIRLGTVLFGDRPS